MASKIQSRPRPRYSKPGKEDVAKEHSKKFANEEAFERTRIYRQPCSQRLPEGKLHTYLFEVHDFHDNKLYGDRYWANIRDFANETSLEIPYSMAHSMIDQLMSCKVDEEELEHSEEDEKRENAPNAHGQSETHFDLESLENRRIFGLDRTFAIEILNDPDSKKDSPTKLLICEPLGKDSAPSAGGDVVKKEEPPVKEERRDILKPCSKKGSLVLTEWLIPRFVLFLKDVSVRHMKFPKGYPSIRSLYAPSGSRRFYFDINETFWGSRLMISQVTSQHRNMISLPLENLLLFRNRLTRLIKQLGIDEETDIHIARTPRIPRARLNGAPRKGARPVRTLVGNRKSHFRGPRNAKKNEASVNEKAQNTTTSTSNEKEVKPSEQKEN